MRKITIIINNNAPYALKACLQSIQSQTHKDIDIITNKVDIDAKVLEFDSLHEGYVLFMYSSQYFENDTVLEDVLLNVHNEDIILCDTVCNKTNDYLSREHIISATLDNASALLASDVFQFHSVIYKRDFLINNELSIADLFDYHQVNLTLIDSILNHKCKWNHLPIPVLHIDGTKSELDTLYRINYDDTYRSELSEIAPLFFNDYKILHELIEIQNNDEQKILQKFGKSLVFKLILKLRELLFKTNYYDKKAIRRTKEFNALQAQKDAARKKEVEKAIEALPPNVLVRKNNASDVVVSLTSHKRRVLDSAPYAIYSMFTQTVLPNRIVLFINKEHWTNDNLPPIIKRLMISGLEVEFCEDVRSHTKLIPALQKFPDNPIITIDDDIYYNEKTNEELLNAYKLNDKKTVICHQGCYPQKRNGKFLPYSDWETSKYKGRDKTKTSLTVSAYGVSGVIYPPKVFPEEVFNKDVFLKIAPHTDDIWFWIMQYKNEIKVEIVENSSQEENISVNYAEYINPDGSLALYFENCFNGRNDIELKALLEYYGIE